MTYQLTVLYDQPDDPAAFDAYYEQTHAPLAARLDGLLSFTASKPDPGPGGAAAAAYFVAELRFADRASFAAAMSSEQGRAATDDVANFATGGATMLTGEVTTYV